jgi:hypothetical protein
MRWRAFWSMGYGPAMTMHPTTPLHLDAIQLKALISFLTDQLGLGQKDVDHFAGCLKRAADEHEAPMEDPGAGQAKAIKSEQARQLILTRAG